MTCGPYCTAGRGHRGAGPIPPRASGLLSVHPCVPCECPDPLVNFCEHFFTQLEHSKMVSRIPFLFLYKDPFFLRPKPLPDSIFDPNILNTSVPKNHPLLGPPTLCSCPSSALAMASLSGAVLHKETKFCRPTEVPALTNLSGTEPAVRAASFEGTPRLTHRHRELPSQSRGAV